MATYSYDIAIVGGGHAGARVAEGIRQVNLSATVVLIGEEFHLPYERPILSKQGLRDPIQLTSHFKRDHSYYSSNRIDLKLGSAVLELDATARELHLSNGDRVQFSRLVVATGSRPRKLSMVEDLKNVFYLRTLDDAVALAACLRPHVKLGIIGAGFIGLEVAATARTLGCVVSVYEHAPTILARVLPPSIARVVQDYHQARGIEIRTNSRISDIRNVSGGRLGVESDVARTDLFDLIVVGVGIQPNVHLAESSGLAMQDGIVVDEYGRTSHPDIFGAGEVTCHPVFQSNLIMRRESWQVAEFQAIATGRTAGGVPTAFREVPWVWSDQAELNIQILGAIPPEADWVFRGDQHSGSFSAFALVDSVIGAAIAINAGRDISAARRLMLSEREVPASRLADSSVSMANLLH